MTYFKDIPVGTRFTYDGDTFRKTDESIAWELRNGRKYKEWCFMPDDKCMLGGLKYGVPLFYASHEQAIEIMREYYSN